MSDAIHLKNQYLDVKIRLPGPKAISQRFDADGVVEQVTLNGRHTFCVPEQLIKGRVTTNGIGLSSEFMDRYSSEAAAGEYFPKMGVGLLLQKEDGARYEKFDTYTMIPFRRRVQAGKRFAEFVQEPRPCLGLSLRIIRRVTLYANTITLTTTVENVGKRVYEASEFQHNFLSIDQIPIGKGYAIEVPYDKELKNIMTRGRAHAKNDGFRLLDKKGRPGKLTSNPVIVEGDKILWQDSMEGKTFHKITREEGIRVMGEYKWRLTCDQSKASVSEIHGFQPSSISLWGVEHCICAEVHHDFTVEPGKTHSFSRVWIFEDETTDGL